MALFKIAKRWKQSKCPFMSEWIDKNVVLHTQTEDYYSALKRNKMLTYSTRWPNLKHIILSEISQIQLGVQQTKTLLTAKEINNKIKRQLSDGKKYLQISFGEGNGYPLQYSCLEIPWTEEPDGLQSMGLQRVRHN